MLYASRYIKLLSLLKMTQQSTSAFFDKRFYNPFICNNESTLIVIVEGIRVKNTDLK